MNSSASITKRLILAVLLIDLTAAVLLILAVTVHERRVQYRAFDANLRGTANVIFGAVQDADDEGDNIVLDLRGVKLSPDAVFKASDEKGRVLGTSGSVPALAFRDGGFQDISLSGHRYRFFTFTGNRTIDPQEQGGGTVHHVDIIYGVPDGHIWNEVLKAVRFFSAATFVLLGATALLLVWLIKRFFEPLHSLATSAADISAVDWQFYPPESARKLVELRPLSLAIEKTIGRLHRSFEQQKRFTSDAAHELKTDLAIIKSSLQLLTLKRRSPEDYEVGLALALEDCRRLEGTVTEMLALARLEQSPADNVHICRLDEMIEHAVRQMMPVAKLKGVTVSVAAITAMEIPLDRRDALLLCSNILLNAVQHSFPDGTIELASNLIGNHVSFTFRDHGEGIRPEDATFLFDAFYRGDSSRSRKSGGTGLGLSICKAICVRVGGSIEIANHADGGAIVTVKMPAEDLSSHETAQN